MHAEGAPPPVSCNLCGFACASVGALKAHMTCSHRQTCYRTWCRTQGHKHRSSIAFSSSNVLHSAGLSLPSPVISVLWSQGLSRDWTSKFCKIKLLIWRIWYVASTVLHRHLAWHDRKLKEAQAKKALERKSRKMKVSNANNNGNEVGEKTSNLLLANQIVNDIVLSVTERDNWYCPNIDVLFCLLN